MLGKPQDIQEVKQMLRLLSGQTHQVYTAVCFTWLEDSTLHSHTLVDCTDVTFLHLTDEQIDYYANKYQPLDKAGAYGVQEWIGYVGVERMNGSYFNVMGFPIGPVYQWLLNNHFISHTTNKC